MLTLTQLTDFCKQHEIPTFRAKQIMHAIYQEGVETFDKITTIPRPVQKLLTENLNISTVTPIAQQESADGSTLKILFKLPDDNTIEGVLMRFKDGRRTVCISSEVGCPLKCKFCASGTLKFKRSLTWEEMADQVIFFSRYIKRQGAVSKLQKTKRTSKKSAPGDADSIRDELNHVVYMGIGEPFRNYDNLIQSLKILMDPEYIGLGARKITVSTAGVVEKIRQFALEPFQVNLALSLHAPTQELRQQIMPIALRYNLDDLMDAIRFYTDKTKRRISFEYVMLRGINDTQECAHQLAKLVKGMLCHVNLIPYNATDIPDIAGSEKSTIRKFQEILVEAGIPATTRVSLGQDIAAACGQLANKTSVQK